MDSLVLELQRDCLSDEVSISNLLRKGMVVSKKLGLTDIEKWIENEINGYGENEKAPGYRIIPGEIVAWNPYRGWIPVVFEDASTKEKLGMRALGVKVSELEALASKGGRGSLTMPFPAKLEASLMRGGSSSLTPVSKIQRSSLVGILECVRNIILNWTLLLEKSGIRGEGMTFTAGEKQAASSITTITIENMINSQIQVGSSDSTQSSN
jgi:hypothetical protein